MQLDAGDACPLPLFVLEEDSPTNSLFQADSSFENTLQVHSRRTRSNFKRCRSFYSAMHRGHGAWSDRSTLIVSAMYGYADVQVVEVVVHRRGVPQAVGARGILAGVIADLEALRTFGSHA